MYFSNISLWGGLLALLLLLVVIVLLWLIDDKTLKKMLKPHVHLPRLSGKMMLTLLISVLVGGFAMAGCLVLSLPRAAFWPLAVLLLICLWCSVPAAAESYLRSLRHTEAHRRYLVANGATHIESLVPSVRRALRSAVLPLTWHRSSCMPIVLLALGCGLLICGASIAATLASVLMCWAAAIVGAVLSTLLLLWLSDRILFDKQGNLTPAASGKL